MTPEEAVYTALVSSAALAALVASGSPPDWRVYPVVAPQKVQFPLVIYRTIGGNRQHTMNGGASLVRGLVQVDAYAHTLEEAKAVAEEVLAVLAGNFATFRGVPQDERFLYDETERAHGVSQDFAVWVS